MASSADTVDTDGAEQAIQAMLDERVVAIGARDPDRLMTVVAPDAVLYDALATLERHGAGAIRAKTEEWLSGYAGPIGYEIRDPHIVAGADVAFCHYLYRVTGTMTAGQQVDMWVRTTICLERREGAWTIVHEHTSVPFDVDSGLARLDLAP